MNIEIKNGYVITPSNDSILVEKKDIYIQDGVLKYQKEFSRTDKIIDAKDKVIFPGLMNAHHHIYSCLSKGIPAEVPFENFQGTLSKLWWKLDRALLKDDVILSTALTLQDCIKSGVTTVFDHHISANYIPNSLSEMAQVFEDFDIDGSLCFEISDRNGEDKFEESLQENIRFAKSGSKIKGMIGLHASFTISQESMEKIAEKTENFPIHMHIAEGRIDEEKCQKEYNMAIIHRLENFGLLRPNSLLIHCSNLTEKELEILMEKNIFIAQAVDSNMNNALNVGNIAKFIGKDIKTTVGTDGMTSNIMKTYKNSYIFTKYLNQSPDVGFPEMQALFLNSYKLKQAFDLPLGVLENDPADIAIFDYQPTTPFNSDTFLGHFIFGITESRTQWVIKNNKILLDDYHLNTTKKYNELIKNREKISQAMFKRFENLK